MKISYAITVCNELEEITKLLNLLLKRRRKTDEIVVLFDKKGGTPEVWSRLQELSDEKNCTIHSATFKNHFADWKNKLTKLCTGDFIFQIDADEYPNKELIETLPFLLEMNKDVDVMLVPRVNTVKGLTQDHIAKWRWSVNEKEWVNWPDYQWRIYKNVPTIKWVNKVHEKLEGFKQYATLPMEEGFALNHPKDIKRQEKQNKYYDTL
jgi:glycosyltransferase involved in cell wall biosynthesis|tara:strand:- start:1946 stop:2569 length:624 start_codon:yes stop_codon:yes gene_type:complete